MKLPDKALCCKEMPEMKTSRKRILIISSVVFCVATFAATAFYRPKRSIVVEVEGPPSRNFDAVFVVDGRRQTQSVTLPKTFTFYARDVAYRVNPVDKDADNEMFGRIYTDDGFADGSSTGWSVGGWVSCSNVLGIWLGEIGVANYTKESPGPEVTTRL